MGGGAVGGVCGGDFPHLPALLLKEIPSTTFQRSVTPLLGSGLLILSSFTKAGLDTPGLLLGLLALLFGQRLSQIWGEQDVEVGQLCRNLLLVHPRLRSSHLQVWLEITVMDQP